MPINQPSNQIRLTNVSLVRLKKGKKRFEIACYKNKVLEWRQGIETDRDNVLQIPQIFLNVSKGQTAPRDDLAKAFGKDKPTDDIILEILAKGELQAGEKERSAQRDRVHAEVLSIVASKLVDPRTKRVYTTGMIDKALDMLSSQAHSNSSSSSHSNHASHGADGGPAAVAPNPAEIPKLESLSLEDDAGGGNAAPPEPALAETAPTDIPTPAPPKPKPVWTGVVTTKSAKSQALEAMKALIAHQPIPVARARMRLRVTCTTQVLKQPVKAPKQQQPQQDDGGEENPKKPSGTVKDRILGFIEQVEKQEVVGSEWEVVGFVEPGAFKGLSDFLGNETKGQGRVEVLDMAVTHDD